MQKKNDVPRGSLVVTTGHGLCYELGPADEKGERTVAIGGRPLTGYDRWGVTFLLVGDRMIYFPEGSYDPEDTRMTPFLVESIQPKQEGLPHA